MNLFPDNDEKHRTSVISSSRMALIPQELFQLQVGRWQDGGLVFLGKTRVLGNVVRPTGCVFWWEWTWICSALCHDVDPYQDDMCGFLYLKMTQVQSRKALDLCYFSFCFFFKDFFLMWIVFRFFIEFATIFLLFYILLLLFLATRHMEP